MDDSADSIFRLSDYKVIELEHLVEDGGMFLRGAACQALDSQYEHVLVYKSGNREVRVYVTERDAFTTRIQLVEKTYALIPKRGTRLVAPAKRFYSKLFARLCWKEFKIERRAVTFVETAEYDNTMVDGPDEGVEALISIAVTGAESLRYRYRITYGEEMPSTPLEDMIITRFRR